MAELTISCGKGAFISVIRFFNGTTAYFTAFIWTKRVKVSEFQLEERPKK